MDDEIYRQYVLWPIIEPPTLNVTLSTNTSPSPPRSGGEGRGEVVPRVQGENTIPSFGDLNWRRELWEYFYPPVRHETDPQSAAQIVLKFLRQRMTIVENGPATINEMWQQKNADLKGFESISIAAFRSVGIPARLNDAGHAEIFADGQWKSL